MVYLDYLLAAVAVDITHTTTKETRLGRVDQAAVEQVALFLAGQEQQLKAWLERPILVQAAVVEQRSTADQLAVVLEDRVLVDQVLSLFVMLVHLHKQLAALYLR